MLTNARAREDYVKAIYQLGEGQPVAAVELARYLGVSRAAVTKFRRVLEDDGFIDPSTDRVDRIRLTARGHSLAVKMVRRHRLVETFLHKTLDVPLDVLHAQAEAIEHVISDDVADRLERFLGNPPVDPHGHPIAQGARRKSTTMLSDAEPGVRIRVESLPDREPSVVRRLAMQRILPGLSAKVVGRDSKAVRLQSASGMHSVNLATASAIRVRVEKPGARA